MRLFSTDTTEALAALVPVREDRAVVSARETLLDAVAAVQAAAEMARQYDRGDASLPAIEAREALREAQQAVANAEAADKATTAQAVARLRAAFEPRLREAVQRHHQALVEAERTAAELEGLGATYRALTNRGFLGDGMADAPLAFGYVLPATPTKAAGISGWQQAMRDHGLL
jgi:hypothetical protein